MRRVVDFAATLCVCASAGSAAAATASIRAKATQEPPVVIAVVGDILLGRGVWRRMQQSGRSPFDRSAAAFRDADLSIGNLEGAVRTEGGTHPGQEFILGLRPEAITLLRRAGVSAVSLANDHAMDYLESGLLATLAALKSAGVGAIGAGRTLSEANRPFLRNVRGRTIAILAHSVVPISRAAAANGRPGLSHSEPAAILRAIASVRPRVDFLLLYVHWGHEFEPLPTAEQRTFARAAAAAGADVVVGTNPHVLQGIESVGARQIFYSLGNFVYDQRRPVETCESAILKLYVRRGAVEARLIPVVSDRDFAPRFADRAESSRILARVSALSAPLGSKLTTRLRSALRGEAKP